MLSVTSKAEDSQKFVEAGFEYIIDLDGVKLFRKRK